MRILAPEPVGIHVTASGSVLPLVRHQSLRQEATLSHSILQSGVQILHGVSNAFSTTRWTSGRSGYNLAAIARDQ
jgi:xylose isomerase